LNAVNCETVNGIAFSCASYLATLMTKNPFSLSALASAMISTSGVSVANKRPT